MTCLIYLNFLVMTQSFFSEMSYENFYTGSLIAKELQAFLDL
jgi:hypothetical protein